MLLNIFRFFQYFYDLLRLDVYTTLYSSPQFSLKMRSVHNSNTFHYVKQYVSLRLILIDGMLL